MLKTKFFKKERLFRTITLLLIKLVISAILIRIALRQMGSGEIGAVFGAVHSYLIVVIIPLIMINWSIQIYRWSTVLKYNQLRVGLKQTVKSYFAGYTFRLVVPGGYAEFFKIYLLKGKKISSFKAFGIELVVVGLLQLVLMAVAVLFLFPEYRIQGLILGILALVCLILLPLLRRISCTRRFLRETDLSYLLMTKLVVSTLLSLILIITQYFVLMRFFGYVSWPESAAAVVILIGSGVVPFTFAGLGVRENLAQYLFGKMGIGGNIAVGISLFVFATNILLPAILGAIIMFFHRLNGWRNTISSPGSALAEPGESISPEAQ